MDLSVFNTLSAQGYTHIPLYKTLLADLDTPLSTYLKLANQPFSYLFESVIGGEKWARYSIIGLPCREYLAIRGYEISHYKDELLLEKQIAVDPLAWVENFQKGFKVAPSPDLPRYYGGLVGYFGYDTVRYIEPRLGQCAKENTLDNPDIYLMVSEEVVVFDNLKQEMHVIVLADTTQTDAFTQAQNRLEQLSKRLLTAPSPLPAVQTTNTVPTVFPQFVSNMEYPEYATAVEKAKNYMLAGDVMQVVLARRLLSTYTAPPINLYRALRSLNPSPYLYYLQFKDTHIVGSSPETLVRVEDNLINLRPIAGTRPRGTNAAEDLNLEQELLNDPKELAEHLMLIDLGRNDVGRVAETGSVNVSEKMIIERYSQVMHIVSNVSGQLKKGMSNMDVLRATFPAGTLTGAPKVRALEIIDELETVKRDVYAGAVGYLGWNGNMDTAIAIRTAVIKNQQISIQVGGGIVVDSTPENEWQETINKSKAVCKAVALATEGLKPCY